MKRSTKNPVAPSAAATQSASSQRAPAASGHQKLLRTTTRRQLDSWNERVFFRPQWANAAATYRLAMTAAMLLICTHWLAQCGEYLGQSGLLNRSTTRFLVGEDIEGSGAVFRISPLYASDSIWLQRSYLGGTIVLLLTAMSGWAGRWSILVAWLAVLGWMHRVSPVLTAGEWLACLLFPLLVIDPGWLRSRWRVGFADEERRWTVRTTIAVARGTLAVWIAVSLAADLAAPAWWDGSAGWMLLGPNSAGDNSWAASALTAYPLLSPLLTNTWLVLTILTLWAVVIGVDARYSAGLLIAYFVIGGLLRQDWWWFVVGVAGSSCYWFDASLARKASRGLHLLSDDVGTNAGQG